MWANIVLDKPLTLGKLRELINDGELSKFPNNTEINMCIDLYKESVEDPEEQPCDNINSIVGDYKSINFYNYK